MFQKIVQKIKTHSTVRSVTLFIENRAVCKIMWKNTAERGGPHMTIWRMHIECWIPKATNMHTEYVLLIAFPIQICSNERASMSRYM